MPLNLKSTGDTVLAADVNQFTNVLQRSAGQTEVGRYKFAGSSYTSGCWIGTYIPSLSRNATPVSVTVDSAGGLSSGLGAPGTSDLTSAGFLVFSTSTTTNATLLAAGNYTIQY